MYDNICPPIEQVTHKEQQTSVLVGGDALINVIAMDVSQKFPYKWFKCLLCLLTEDITARTSSKKLRFEKRFFLGIFKSKFLQHALSVDHGIDSLICDVMRQIQELKNRLLCMLIPFLGSLVLL